jgi:RHS repeat-associated protein
MRNKVGIIEISSYDYSVNAIGLRTSVATSGTAFSGASGWSWAYDSLGQVTLAEHGTNSNFHRSYAYDAIGNRQRAADGTLDVNDTSAAVYTANALNQYSSINDPQSSIINPVHDADGNMTSGPLPVDPASASSLTWDAENRLISATVDTTTVTYTYDAQSRRIATKVGSNTTLFVYDGWNPIAEWSADLQSASLTKTFTWGMDLSGSSQGAGGVGGLLAVAIHDQQSSIYYPTYDGNGNVSEYLDATGAIVAHYEYDPFGRIVVESGSQAADFAHRFSTKPVDSVTGLLYYGYRWYDPVTGRWPSRDPIEEEGGINLYGFVGNDGVKAYDYLGKKRLVIYGGGPQVDGRGFYFGFGIMRKDACYEYRIGEITFDPHVNTEPRVTGAFGSNGVVLDFDSRQVLRSGRPTGRRRIFNPYKFRIIIKTEKRKLNSSIWEHHNVYSPRFLLHNDPEEKSFGCYNAGTMLVTNIHNISSPNPSLPLDTCYIPWP